MKQQEDSGFDSKQNLTQTTGSFFSFKTFKSINYSIRKNL